MSKQFRCRGAKIVHADEHSIVYDSVDNDDEAELWGVYKSDDDGIDCWVADFDTRELAEEYIKLRETHNEHRASMLPTV